MSRSYTATVPACVVDPDDEERELEVEFDFTPGEPETPPSYASGGEPATGPEIEITNVTYACSGIVRLSDDGDDDKLADWLAENWDGPDEPDYD